MGHLPPIALILEATRRTVGWILPAICLLFLAYAYLGGLVPEALAFRSTRRTASIASSGRPTWAWRASSASRSTSPRPTSCSSRSSARCSSTPAPRASSSELSYAAFGRSRTGPGRTTTLAGFLLGTVSGSGVATTVTLGSADVAAAAQVGLPEGRGRRHPGRQRHRRDPRRRRRSGAAAFIIAEFLEESYLKVLVYALVPSVLYYLGDPAGDRGRRAAPPASRGSTSRRPGFWRLLARWGYHFSSLIADRACCWRSASSPFRAVLVRDGAWRSCCRFLDRRDWMGPRRVWEALVAGAPRRAADRGHHRGGGDHRRGRLAHRARPGAVRR